MHVQFCGAARTVTGSSHLITLDDGYKILLDCGLYQGNEDRLEEFNENFYFDPKDVNVVILSHAHIDHSGRLPKLVKEGYRGQIISTFATRDLASIMLMDSAFIQVRDAEWTNKKKKLRGANKKKALYEPKDTVKCMRQFVGIGYDRWHKLSDKVSLLFKDSGHILGSASITLKIRTGKGNKFIGFTGDIGRPDRPILRNPDPMPQCDYLICESTYGDKLHDKPPREEKRFLKIIKETCIKNRGKLIIPAFSVGRTQEIVYIMDRMETAKKLPKVPVYVDSPLAVNATDIFRLHPECYDPEITRYMSVDPNPFGFSGLNYIRRVEESKKLNNKEAAVIISASGMITAGRIKHHVYNSIENPRNTILIVGYCSPDSIGGQLRAGAKEISIFGERKKVKANVEIMDSFSAHGDQREMARFLDNQDRKKLRKLFLVHGDLEKGQAFKEYLKKKKFKTIYIPKLKEVYNLD